MKIFSGQTSKAFKGLKEGRYTPLKESDVAITEKTFSDNTMKVGSEISVSGINISLGEKYISAQSLNGVYPSDAEINKREMVAGRFVNEIDMKEKRKVIALWQEQAKELDTDYLSLIGRHVKVDGLAFKVIGIVKDDKQNQSVSAFIPYTTLKTIYAKGDDAGSIQFEIKNLVTEEQNKEFEKNYRAHINIQHNAAPDDESAMYIWNRYMDNIQMTTGIAIIRSALWIIGLFTLLSGIVGVSNIMLITVKERTREFGVRKAIGAKPWHILKLIITESVITTALFGYIGMLCGIGVNEYMNATIGHEVVDTGLFQASMFLNPTVGLDVCIQATLVIIVAGTIAGLIPAVKAARVRPIEALRAE